jgi:hypothetical protein
MHDSSSRRPREGRLEPGRPAPPFSGAWRRFGCPGGRGGCPGAGLGKGALAWSPGARVPWTRVPARSYALAAVPRARSSAARGGGGGIAAACFHWPLAACTGLQPVPSKPLGCFFFELHHQTWKCKDDGWKEYYYGGRSASATGSQCVAVHTRVHPGRIRSGRGASRRTDGATRHMASQISAI